MLHALSLLALACPVMEIKLPGLFVQPVAAAMSAPPTLTLLAERLAPRKQALALALGMPLASFLGTGAVPALLGICGTYLNFGFGFASLGLLAAAALFLMRITRFRHARVRHVSGASGPN